MAHTPAMADSIVETISVGDQTRLCRVNLAKDIGRIDRGKGGAGPWTLVGLKIIATNTPKAQPPT